MSSIPQDCQGLVGKKRKDWETVQDQERLGRENDNMQCGSLYWILKQKEDINGKTDKI